MHPLDDTIAAVATAPGEAGLAVIRVSGPAALAVADAVFRGAAPLAAAPGHTLHHGWAVWPGAGAGAEAGGGVAPRLPVVARTAPAGAGADDARAADLVAGADDARAADLAAFADDARAADLAASAADAVAPGRRLDEVVAAVFRAPRSYTREDVVELSCHGGRIATGRVLAAALRAGARLARPGEFTLRAFLHGRLDLAQAEAVADLVRAETGAAHELALSQLAGGPSRRILALSAELEDALAEVEARVDFAEDVGGIEVPAHVVAALGRAAAALDALRAGGEWARAVREGARVPIVGRPNAGKSSLFNALLGEARAIVTDVPGTTRDRVSEPLEVAGVRVTLSDTAGLRHAPEPVEALGVALAREALDGAALALWVVDGAAPLDDEDRWIADRLAGRRAVVVLSKCDLPPRAGVEGVRGLLGDGHAATPVLPLSAATGVGLDALRAALAAALGAGPGRGALAGALSNPRHLEAVGRAREALERAAEAAAGGAPGEIVALELRESLGALGEITGRAVGEDLLDRIFARFCVGK